MNIAFAKTLLDWFAVHGRDLPWRHTHDPYAIWLSEVILQQTRIVQGLSYWERFMETWPTVEALAEADEDEVLKLWQGLGYYSRARNLHTAAKQIVAGGYFPKTLPEIKQLKGVGDYTAAAIASFAFGLPTATVDGNVYRVLSRYQGIDVPINSTEAKKLFPQLAQSLFPEEGGERGATFNQAMMDFGATQCVPKSPDCAICPFVETCVAFREHRVAELPVKLKTVKIKERKLVYVYIRFQGSVAIRQRGAGDIWQGLWEPYLLADEMDVNDLPKGKLVKLREHVKHVLTHRIIYADFYLYEPENKPSLSPDYIWIKEDDLSRYAVPRLMEILFRSL